MVEQRRGLWLVLLGLGVIAALFAGLWVGVLSDDGTDESHQSAAPDAKTAAQLRRERERERIAERRAARAAALAKSNSEAAEREAEAARREKARLAAEASERHRRAGAKGLSSDGGLLTVAGQADAGADGAATASGTIPPNEQGALVVTVIHADTGKPVSSAEVFAPLAIRRVEVDGVLTKIPASFAPYRKMTDAEGRVTYASSELEKPGTASGESASTVARVVVLATATGMVPAVTRLEYGRLRLAGDAITLKLAPAYEVSGTVSDPKGNKIAGAKVSLRQGNLASDAGQQAQSPEDALEATSDTHGAFRIAIAKSFSYQVHVTADGYVPYESKVFDFRRDERTLNLILKHGRSLDGIVVHSGQPVTGATVTSLTDGTTTTTDAEGRFYLTALQDRIYSNRVKIRVTKTGLSPRVSDELVNTRELRIEMAAESTLEGRVLEASEPVVGVRVTAVFRQGDRDWPIADVVTSVEGTFRFVGLGDGTVTIRAFGSNGRTSRKEAIRLRAAETRGGVDLQLVAGAVVNGRLVARGADGSQVGIGGAVVQSNGTDAATTAWDGAFVVSGLGDEAYEFAVANKGTIPEHLAKLKLFTVDGQTFYHFPTPRRVNTNPGATYEVLLEAEKFYDDVIRVIHLDLTLASGASADGVSVVATPATAIGPGGVKVSAQTVDTSLANGIGQARLVLVEGVDYTVTVAHPRVMPHTVPSARLRGLSSGDRLAVSLDAAMAFTGYVKDSAGNAIPDADCTVLDGGRPVSTAKSDPLGFFDLGGLEAKQYTLNIFRHSYYLYSQRHHATTHSPQPITAVLLGANEIRLLITDGAGTPMPGTRVRISRPASNAASSRIEYFDLGETDGEGRKITNFHWIRNYQVVANRGNNFIGFVNFDNISAQNTREFTLELEAAALITGRVVSQSSGQPVTDVDMRAQLEGGGPERAGNAFWQRTNANGDFSVLVPQAAEFTLHVRESRAYAAAAGPNARAGDQNVIVPTAPKERVEGNWAEFVSIDVPSGITAGSQFTARVTVRNRGSTSWTAGDNFRVGSEAPRDNNRWGLGRISLGAGEVVHPGGAHTFVATLTAPAAGNHAMQWRMVQEHREWFGEFSTRIVVPIAPAAPK